MYDRSNIWCPAMMIRNTRDLGGFLRQAREHAGLTQAALADSLSVRRQRVLYLERGEGQLQIAFVFAVLKALKLEMSLALASTPVTVSAKRGQAKKLAAPYSIDDIADGGS